MIEVWLALWPVWYRSLHALPERARNSREGGREGCPRYKAKAKVRKIREIVECTFFGALSGRFQGALAT